MISQINNLRNLPPKRVPIIYDQHLVSTWVHMLKIHYELNQMIEGRNYLGILFEPILLKLASGNT